MLPFSFAVSSKTDHTCSRFETTEVCERVRRDYKLDAAAGSTPLPSPVTSIRSAVPASLPSPMIPARPEGNDLFMH